ncbi:hypothetical protein XELAEV_18001148mg [Xenopus laevis]|nr:hypothetical protein XELAEV_18001148mg [Xenopus laevis]
MGVQLVVTLLVACIMQRVSSHYSFDRWLLCNGSLFRYRHPTEQELCALAGKQKPKAKRESDVTFRGRAPSSDMTVVTEIPATLACCVWQIFVVTDEKPLTVPKDIDLRLDTQPISTIDTLVLRYFLEYQWFIDFALYSTIIYLFTEAYYCVADAQNEINIGVLWCLMSIIFSIKVLYTVMKHYFRSEEGGERSVCLTFALFILLISGVWAGTSLIALVALCSFLGGFLTFPGSFQTHLDALKMAADRPMLQLLLHMSFLPPVIVVVLWIRPITRDFLLIAPMGKDSIELMSNSAYNTFRLWIIVVLCLLHFCLTRFHLQAYLCLADRWVEQMKREAGHFSMLEIQRKYLAPVILTFHCVLMLKSLGDCSWGLYPEPSGFTPVVDSSPVQSHSPSSEEEEEAEDVQAAVEQIIGALTSLRGLFSPLFFRGLFSFLTWWVSVCQIVTSLFGLYFHQYLGAS